MSAEGAKPRAIWQACNELPGDPIARSDSTKVRISTLKARSAGPAVAAPTSAGGPLAGLPDHELTEAREMLANPSNGARHLAEYFGWTLARAQEIAAAIRAEHKAAAA